MTESRENLRDRNALTLTVLGATAPYPGPGTATPGYLVEGFGARILLDCGSGVLSRLWSYCDPVDLDAVILSHLHFDHCADILVLRYAVDVAARTGRLTRPVPVWCPREPRDVWALASYKEALEARPLEPDLVFSVGRMGLKFAPVKHPVETYAVQFHPPSGENAILFYTADTGWFDGLPELVGAPHILLVEASLLENEASLGVVTGHLTAGEATRLGAMTGAEKTVLTHYPPGRDTSLLATEAGKAAGHRVEVVVEGLTLTRPQV